MAGSLGLWEDPVLGQVGWFGTLLFWHLAWQSLETLHPSYKEWHWVDGVLPIFVCKATVHGLAERSQELGASAEELHGPSPNGYPMGTRGNNFPPQLILKQRQVLRPNFLCLENVLKYHQVSLFPQRLITPSLNVLWLTAWTLIPALLITSV